MTLDDPSVTRCLFHPRAEPAGYFPSGRPTEIFTGEVPICGYLHEYPESDTLILFFHGNGEIAADYDALAPVFTGAGAAFWVMDYRGYGRSAGRPTYSDMLMDAEAVLKDIKNLRERFCGDYRRIILMGRSLGSASAIHLAARHPGLLAGLVLDSAFADLLALIRRLGGPQIRRDTLPDFEDNVEKMRRCRLPTLILHGTADRVIPVDEAEALCDACGSPDRQILKISGGGHNDLLIKGGREYVAALSRFVGSIPGARGCA